MVLTPFNTKAFNSVEIRKLNLTNHIQGIIENDFFFELHKSPQERPTFALQNKKKLQSLVFMFREVEKINFKFITALIAVSTLCRV